MRLVTYWDSGSWRCGVLVDDTVVDAARAARDGRIATSEADTAWTATRGVLARSGDERRRLEESARVLAADGGLALSEARLGPPVPDPDKIICLGLNYRAHAEEFGEDVVDEMPVLFTKFRNALIGSGDPIVLSELSAQVDFEGELAVVIGQPARDVDPSEALDYVAGYMPMNDVTARDLQSQTSQWLPAKTLDTFAPCGPALVTSDEVGDVQRLSLVTRVNGEVMQESNTSLMIFSVAEAVAAISRLTPLLPGDVIATGTPEGVGFKRTPPVFLAPGDAVDVEIDGLGCLSNEVIAAQPRSPAASAVGA